MVLAAALGVSAGSELLPRSSPQQHTQRTQLAHCSPRERVSHLSKNGLDTRSASDDGSFGQMDTVNLCLVAGDGNKALAAEVSDLIGVPLASMTFKRFSDGEHFIRFDENIRGRDVFVFQSCASPVNDSVMELLLTISCARRSGARKVIAVVPYFGYKHHRRASQISTKHQSRYLSSGAMDFAKMMQVRV